MKTKNFKIYYSIITVILLGLYIGLFLTFANRPYSSQQIMLLVLIPSILILDWIAVFIQASFSTIDQAIASGVVFWAMQAAYTALALALGLILPLFKATIKVQIAVQLTLLTLLAIVFVVSLFIASHTKSTNKSRKYVEQSKDARETFKLAVMKMESLGLKGVDLSDLEELCNEYIHIAPCSDPAVLGIDGEIASTLSEMIDTPLEQFAPVLMKLRFLVKRRAMFRSK